MINENDNRVVFKRYEPRCLTFDTLSPAHAYYAMRYDGHSAIPILFTCDDRRRNNIEEILEDTMYPIIEVSNTPIFWNFTVQNKRDNGIFERTCTMKIEHEFVRYPTDAKCEHLQKYHEGILKKLRMFNEVTKTENEITSAHFRHEVIQRINDSCSWVTDPSLDISSMSEEEKLKRLNEALFLSEFGLRVTRVSLGSLTTRILTVPYHPKDDTDDKRTSTIPSNSNPAPSSVESFVRITSIPELKILLESNDEDNTRLKEIHLVRDGARQQTISVDKGVKLSNPNMHEIINDECDNSSFQVFLFYEHILNISLDLTPEVRVNLCFSIKFTDETIGQLNQSGVALWEKGPSDTPSHISKLTIENLIRDSLKLDKRNFLEHFNGLSRPVVANDFYDFLAATTEAQYSIYCKNLITTEPRKMTLRVVRKGQTSPISFITAKSIDQ